MQGCVLFENAVVKPKCVCAVLCSLQSVLLSCRDFIRSADAVTLKRSEHSDEESYSNERHTGPRSLGNAAMVLIFLFVLYTFSIILLPIMFPGCGPLGHMFSTFCRCCKAQTVLIK